MITDLMKVDETESSPMTSENSNEYTGADANAMVQKGRDASNPFLDGDRCSTSTRGSLPNYESGVTAIQRDNAQSLTSIPQHSASLEVIHAQQEEWYLALRELQANMNELKRLKRTPYFTLQKLPSGKFATLMCGFRKNKLRKNPNSRAASVSHQEQAVAVNGVDELGNTTLTPQEQLERQAREQDIRIHEELVLAGMRRLSATHPDPAVQAEWALRAEKFAKTLTEGSKVEYGVDGLALDFKEQEKENILAEIGKGLALLFMTPVVATGVMLYGIGKFVVGMGHLMTFGKLR